MGIYIGNIVIVIRVLAVITYKNNVAHVNMILCERSVNFRYSITKSFP